MIANTNKQLLKDHLLAVGQLAQDIAKKTPLKQNYIKNFDKISFLSGLFHDLGKIDPNFQEYLSKKINDEDISDGVHQGVKVLENRATHNEISWAILVMSKVSVFGQKLEQIDPEGYINYSVLFHHKLLKRSKHDYKGTYEIWESIYKDYNTIKQNLNNIVKDLNQAYFNLYNENLDLIIELPEKDNRISIAFPKFKESTRNFIQYNSRSTLIRSILISSDRHISQKDGSALRLAFENKRVNKIIDGYTLSQKDNHLKEKILQGVNDISRFPRSDRSLSQEKTAEKLNKKFSVLGGPPGCGKTRIALFGATQSESNQIFWVCPRLYICEAVFEELYRDYLPTGKIELFTGDKKLIKDNDSPLRETPPDEELTGDVIILTIDQLLSIFLKNGRTQNLPKILSSYFIFDEFHEIFQIPNMIMILKELLYLLDNVESSRVLLMSATPNPCFLSKIKDDFIQERDLILAEDFHDKDISVFIHNSSRPQEESVIDIYNIVAHAQEDYEEDNTQSMLFHSSFTKEDRDKIFEQLIKDFGKNGIHGSKKILGLFTNLRAGPIVQASLNISAQKVRSDKASPDNLCQRIGRCDRFGIGGGIFEIIEKDDGSSTAYLSRVEYSTNASKDFISFLKKKGFSSNYKNIKRKDFMELYYEFQRSNKSSYEKDWERIEKKAMEFYSNIEEAKYIMGKTKKKMVSSSFRGDSIYILPCEDNLTQYVYDIKNVNPRKTITLSSDHLDLEDIIKNFVKLAKSSHFADSYGYSFNKYTSKDIIVKSIARSPETPIFSSFTDFDCKNGSTQNIDVSLFYVPFSKDKKYYGLINKLKLNKIKEKI